MLAALLRAKLGNKAIIESAGTAAAEGEPASAGAVRAMQRRGLSLADHRARALAEVDLEHIAHFLCMSSQHAMAVRRLGVPATRIRVVNAESGGVPDPFAGDDDDYEACASVLERFANTFVP